MGLEAGRIVHVTATAVIQGTATRGGIFHNVRLAAGVDAATATVRENGSGGNIIGVLKAGIDLSDEWRPGRTYHEGQLHVTVTGTTPDVSVAVD